MAAFWEPLKGSRHRWKSYMSLSDSDINVHGDYQCGVLARGSLRWELQPKGGWQVTQRLTNSAIEEPHLNAEDSTVWKICTSALGVIRGRTVAGRSWMHKLHPKNNESPYAVTTSEVEGVGTCDTMAVKAEPPEGAASGLEAELEFAMPHNKPFLMWRLRLTNASTAEVHVDSIELLDATTHTPQDPLPENLDDILGGLVTITGTMLFLALAILAAAKLATALGEQESSYSLPLVETLAPLAACAYAASYLARHAARLSSRAALGTFFVHGWQSWGFTGSLRAYETQPDILVPDAFSRAFHLGGRLHCPTPRYSHMFGALARGDQHKPALVAGFLSQSRHFGSVTSDLKHQRLGMQCDGDGVLLPPAANISTDWAVLHLLEEAGMEPFAQYMEAVRVFNSARNNKPVPTGWCSWYMFFEKVSEDELLDNLDVLRSEKSSLPIDMIQLDDGYPVAWGDWNVLNDRFPDDLKNLTSRIVAAGFTPGLWMAPLTADKASQLARDHPEWILRTKPGLNSTPVNSGYTHPGKWFYALDITHPEVQAHVRDVITVAVHDWGFKYLKLDFLYCAALPGARHDATLTRAECMHLALKIFREAAGEDIFIMGCSIPVGAAIGHVDSIRVSSDAGLAWRPEFPLPNDKMNLPAARNAVRNTLNRSPMHASWFLNDPDCLLMRPTTSLTAHELQGILTVVAMCGGPVIVSDDMKDVKNERLRMLQALLPPSGRSAVVHDILQKEEPEVMSLEMEGPAGKWTLLAVCNWRSRMRKVDLADIPALRVVTAGDHGEVHALHSFEFWGATYRERPSHPECRTPHNLKLPRPSLEAHAAHLYALRPVIQDRPAYLGSDLHFSCGSEVIAWNCDTPGEVLLTLDIGKRYAIAGKVWLYLPQQQAERESSRIIKATGSAYGGHLKNSDDHLNVVVITVSFDGRGDLHVKF